MSENETEGKKESERNITKPLPVFTFAILSNLSKLLSWPLRKKSICLMSKSSKIWLITFILSIWLLGSRPQIVYSFHGAKPPALHLINFLLFIWLRLYSSFSLGNFPVFGRPRLLELWSIIIYSHLNCLILSVSVFVTAELNGLLAWKKMKQKLICQDQIVRRWNYTHQDQLRSNVGERSLWQGNDQNGFYTAFRRAGT